VVHSMFLVVRQQAQGFIECRVSLVIRIEPHDVAKVTRSVPADRPYLSDHCRCAQAGNAVLSMLAMRRLPLKRAPLW
jgi:hypothetical protein